jgi:hypothetical protein
MQSSSAIANDNVPYHSPKEKSRQTLFHRNVWGIAPPAIEATIDSDDQNEVDPIVWTKIRQSLDGAAG